MEILLIIILSLWLFRKPSNHLYCGIFAWTGDSNKKFNWDKFNMLGILNNERGKDSCGRASGNISQYGTGKYSNYDNFIKETPPFPIKERMIIGHDRKASWGYTVNEGNAQPVILEEGNEVVFILAHNGTIHNIDDLAKKYNIIKGNNTDSWVLANIIYKNGFNVLKEYEGAASLVMYDRRKYLETGNTHIHLFKGESKYNSWSQTSSEERPLYLLNKGNNSVYISSLEDPLWIIGGNKDNIYDIATNKVFTIVNGVFLENIIDIDRFEMTQIKTHYKNFNYEYNDNYYYRKEYIKEINIENENFSFRDKHVDFRRGLFRVKEAVLNGIIHLTEEGEIVAAGTEKSVPFYFINGVMLKNHENFQKATRAINTLNTASEEDTYRILLNYSKYPIYFDTGAARGKCYYTIKDGTRHIYHGDLQPEFSSFRYTIKNGIVTASEYINLDRRIYPTKLFKLKQGEYYEEVDKVSYNYPALIQNNNFEEDYNNMEDSIIETEISYVMANLLEAFQTARSNLQALGDTDTIKILVDNLDTVEDKLFYEKDGGLYKKQLKLDVEWIIPF